MLSKICQTLKCEYCVLPLMDNLDFVHMIKARRGLSVGNRERRQEGDNMRASMYKRIIMEIRKCPPIRFFFRWITLLGHSRDFQSAEHRVTQPYGSHLLPKQTQVMSSSYSAGMSRPWPTLHVLMSSLAVLFLFFLWEQGRGVLSPSQGWLSLG